MHDTYGTPAAARPPRRHRRPRRMPGRGRLPSAPFRSALALLALAAAAPAREYRAIKGESSLSYVLVHPLHKVTGVNREFECVVDLSDDTVSSAIRVSADVLKFDSGNSSRDSHAMEVVEYRKHPKVSFASTSIKPAGDGYDVAGELSFHGATRPVAFHVVPEVGASRIGIAGTFTVKLSDFGVARPRLLLIPVKDELTLRFELFAEP